MSFKRTTPSCHKHPPERCSSRRRRSSAHDGVVHAEPELTYALHWTPNDPYYTGGNQPHYAAIDMANAWEASRPGSSPNFAELRMWFAER